MPVLVGGGLGVAKAVTGLINSEKAKKEAKRLEASRPLLKDSAFLGDQLNLAQSELANGMSGESEKIYQQGEDRSLSASLNAILKGGGDVNNVADVFDASAQGRSRLALMNDNLRLSQINNLVKAQDTNEQFRQQQFGLNEYKPYADKVAANSAARTGAQDQIWSGINTLGSAAISAFAPKYDTGSGGNQSISGDAPKAVNPGFMSTIPTPLGNTSPASHYPTLPVSIPNPIMNYNVTPTADANTGWAGIPYQGVQEPITPWGN